MQRYSVPVSPPKKKSPFHSREWKGDFFLGGETGTL